MLLAELKPDGSVRELEDVQKPLALGRETFRTGTLSAASIQKSVNMLRQYRAIMDTYGVTHTRAVATSDLRALADKILGMSAAEVAAAYSIPTPEAESLAPAFMVYAELIKLNPVDRLLVARASIRDGLLLQVARSIQSGSSVFFPEQTIAAALNLARKYRADERHGLHTATLARAIFEATRAQHGMGEGERLLLEVASIVHDIGNYVAPRGHHRHAYYLLVNSEVFGLSKMDLEIVANVARYHRKGTPQSDHPAYAALPRSARLTVNRLSAILRVADALDKTHG